MFANGHEAPTAHILHELVRDFEHQMLTDGAKHPMVNISRYLSLDMVYGYDPHIKMRGSHIKIISKIKGWVKFLCLMKLLTNQV